MDNDNSSYDGINHHIVGGPVNDESLQTDVKKYQKWIRASEGKEKKKYNKWAKQGASLYSKDGEAGGEMLPQDEQRKSQIFKHSLNYLRQPIERQIAQTFARNPKFVAKPLQPIWVDMEPTPVMVPGPVTIDPMSGQPMEGEPQPMIDSMTGQPVMDYHINPETGMPFQQDISDEVADTVESLMEVEIAETDFKAESKACTREAHHSPGSVMQVGYEFNPDTNKDGVYFRRRPFKNFIIDPKARIYDGVVRRCRYMGLKWELTKAEAESLGLNWEAMTNEKNLAGTSDDPDEKTACVYNIWDRESGVVVWVPEYGEELAMEAQEWPWRIKQFPFVILKFTEDTDKQFSKPPVLEVAGIQEELEVQREEIAANTVFSRPYNLYDPNVIDEDKITAFAGRGQGANIAVQGLLGMPNSPIRRESTDGLSQEFYMHYERNRQEMVEMLGSSQNEALRTTKSTAKEAEIVNANAGNATSAKIDILTDFLNNCIEVAVDIMKDMYDEPRVTQVLGRDNIKRWVQWTGTEVLKDVSISMESGSTEREDSTYNQQVNLNMLETMKSVPGVDVLRLAVDVLRDHGKRNPEQYRLDMQQQQQGQPQPHPAGVGPTDGRNVGQSIDNQMNPMV